MTDAERAQDYDLIIVGGRIAGAALAIALGRLGLRVLLLERDALPSLPAVSMPIIYPSSMKLLDALGVAESEYAHNTPPVRRLILEARDDFRSVIPVPALFGRDYGYCIDRARFDAALWRAAERQPSVTARQRFVVTELRWTGEQVTGVVGHLPGGEPESFSARGVIGADGRFSLVARQVKAEVTDEHTELPENLYYAYWKGVAPYDERQDAVLQLSISRDFGRHVTLLFDSADQTVAVGLAGQSARLDPGSEPLEAYYLRLLRERPRVWRRLERAELVTDVRGMKQIGNLYRRAGGPGWALVGDALHQKDPIDQQGIHDALLTAQLLARELETWHEGRQSWDEAVKAYEQRSREATFPMFQATLERIKREIYTPTPDWVWKTILRWANAHPEYQRRLGLLLGRGIEPLGWMPGSLIPRAIVRGLAGDLRRLVTRQPDPLAPLPLSET